MIHGREVQRTLGKNTLSTLRFTTFMFVLLLQHRHAFQSLGFTKRNLYNQLCITCDACYAQPIVYKLRVVKPSSETRVAMLPRFLCLVVWVGSWLVCEKQNTHSHAKAHKSYRDNDINHIMFDLKSYLARVPEKSEVQQFARHSCLFAIFCFISGELWLGSPSDEI